MRQVTKSVLAALLLVGASGAAWAVPAMVETDLNVRSGPSTGYPVLDTMPAGATVDVVACYSGWCEIVWDGFGGFASRAYLAVSPGVTVIEPPAGAIVAPGIVVYETRYFDRPIWSSRGHIIRQAIRRDIRRDLRRDRREVRQERREDRRELRRDRREDRREVTQERRERREVIQERRERRAERNRDTRRDIRRTRDNRAEVTRERSRGAEPRRNVERRSITNSRAKVQEQRKQRREVRQQRRNEAAQARPQRERRETTGRR